ncbi:MAG: PaaI family thioesterase [Bacteroidia bacterium]
MIENKFELRNPDYVETIKEKLKGQHFMHLIGFDLSKIELGKVEGEMPLEQKHLQQFGFVHGGLTTTIMDITMGFSAYSLLSKNQGVVTANLSVDFLNPGYGDSIIAKAEVEKAGSKLIFCTAKVYTVKDGITTHIASARGVMAVVEKN